MQLLRSLLSILLAIIAGVAVVAAIESIGHWVFPPAKEFASTNPEQLRRIMEQIPLGALLFILLAWIGGQFMAGFIAAKIAHTSKRNHALIAGSVIMLLGIFTLFVLPHPLWFSILALVLFIPSSYFGYKTEHWLFSKNK